MIIQSINIYFKYVPVEKIKPIFKQLKLKQLTAKPIVEFLMENFSNKILLDFGAMPANGQTEYFRKKEIMSQSMAIGPSLWI